MPPCSSPARGARPLPKVSAAPAGTRSLVPAPLSPLTPPPRSPRLSPAALVAALGHGGPGGAERGAAAGAARQLELRDQPGRPRLLHQVSGALLGGGKGSRGGGWARWWWGGRPLPDCSLTGPCVRPRSEEAKSTTWLHPLTGEAVITGHRRSAGRNLPCGRAATPGPAPPWPLGPALPPRPPPAEPGPSRPLPLPPAPLRSPHAAFTAAFNLRAVPSRSSCRLVSPL